MLKFSGKIASIVKKEKSEKYPATWSYQFLDSSTDDLKIIKVKSEKDLLHKKGDEVSIDVVASCFDNKIYFKTV